MAEKALKTRIIIGTALFLGVIIAFLIDYIFGFEYAVFILLMYVVTIGLLEFYKMLEIRGFHPLRLLSVGVGLLALAVHFSYLKGWMEQIESLKILGFMAFLYIFFVFLYYLIRPQEGPTLENISFSVFGITYLVFLGTFLLDLRFLKITDEKNLGAMILLLTFLVVKSGDIGAYFIGIKFGAHKLVARVSPNKSIEGGIGGLGLSIIVALFVSQFSILRQIINIPVAIFFGLIIGLTGQIGDLAESLMKRSIKIKDSGKLFPAFGGMLDMIDSLLFSAPAAYFFLTRFTGVK